MNYGVMYICAMCHVLPYILYTVMRKEALSAEKRERLQGRTIHTFIHSFVIIYYSIYDTMNGSFAIHNSQRMTDNFAIVSML